MKRKKYPPGERIHQDKTFSRAGDERRQTKAYGDKVSICANAECIMRKKTKCRGFEGCPGYMGK